MRRNILNHFSKDIRYLFFKETLTFIRQPAPASDSCLLRLGARPHTFSSSSRTSLVLLQFSYGAKIYHGTHLKWLTTHWHTSALKNEGFLLIFSVNWIPVKITTSRRWKCGSQSEYHLEFLNFIILGINQFQIQASARTWGKSLNLNT